MSEIAMLQEQKARLIDERAALRADLAAERERNVELTKTVEAVQRLRAETTAQIQREVDDVFQQRDVALAEVAQLRDFAKTRRLHHFTYGSYSSGCCRNCDRQLEESIRCSREGCDAPYSEWQTTPCVDPNLDAALAGGAAGHISKLATRRREEAAE